MRKPSTRITACKVRHPMTSCVTEAAANAQNIIETCLAYNVHGTRRLPKVVADSTCPAPFRTDYHSTELMLDTSMRADYSIAVFDTGLCTPRARFQVY